MNNAPNINDPDLDFLNSSDDAYNPLLLTAQVFEFLMSETAGTENRKPKTES
jgi:hypothetical protein